MSQFGRTAQDLLEEQQALGGLWLDLSAIELQPAPEPPMTVSIEVDQLSHNTFASWTDGPKVILDLEGDYDASKRPKDVFHVVCDTSNVLQIMELASPVSTFFVITNIRDFIWIKNRAPTRNLRLLLV